MATVIGIQRLFQTDARRLTSSTSDGKLEAVKGDPESRAILDFLLDLPKSEFIFYGQIIKDIYDCKVQRDEPAAKQHLERMSLKETNQLKVNMLSL